MVSISIRVEVQHDGHRRVWLTCVCFTRIVELSTHPSMDRLVGFVVQHGPHTAFVLPRVEKSRHTTNRTALALLGGGVYGVRRQ